TNSTNLNVAAGATANINGTLPSTATVNANGITNFGGTTGGTALARPLTALNIGTGTTASITASNFPFTPTVLQPTTLTFADASAKLDVGNNAVIATGDATAALGLIASGQVFSSQPAD